MNEQEKYEPGRRGLLTGMAFSAAAAVVQLRLDGELARNKSGIVCDRYTPKNLTSFAIPNIAVPSFLERNLLHTFQEDPK